MSLIGAGVDRREARRVRASHGRLGLELGSVLGLREEECWDALLWILHVKGLWTRPLHLREAGVMLRYRTLGPHLGLLLELDHLLEHLEFVN